MKCLKFSVAAFCILSCTLFFSCEENKQGGDTEPQNKPSEFVSSFDPSNERLPIDWSDGVAEASPNGVSIEVTHAGYEDYKFICRPGASIKSYRLGVLPVAYLYNILLDGDMVDKSEINIAEAIRSCLFSTSAEIGFTFTEESFPDWRSHEFDWTNSSYSKVKGIPDCDYLIVAVGCFDEKGAEQADLTICHFSTKSRSLVGNPECELDVNVGYRKFSVNHVPNADCKYVYYFGTETSMIDEYISVFGERLLRDFLRVVMSNPIAADDTENLSYFFDYGQAADPNLSMTTLCVPLDENYTPAATYNRKDFHFKEIPANANGADCTIEPIHDRISCSYAEYRVTMEANCYAAFYRVLPKDEADFYKSADEATQQALATELDMSGWGVKNENWSFDRDEEVPTGTSFSTVTFQFGEPGKEYVIAYCGRNSFGTVSELRFSEPFTLKERVTDSPELCKANLKLTFDQVMRTQYRFNFTYDPQNIGAFYFAYIEPATTPTVPSKDASRQEWLDYIYSGVNNEESGVPDETNQTPSVMVWWKDDSGYDSYVMAGMQPETRYEVVYFAEDMDGVVSEVKFASVSTTELSGGNDPQMNVTATKDDSGKWTFSFGIVKDVERYLYMLGDSNNLKDLDYLGASGTTYEDFYDYWFSTCSEYGLSSFAEVSTLEDAGNGLAVAMCIAVGRDAEGNEVYSPLFHVIRTKDGELKTLRDFYPEN